MYRLTKCIQQNGSILLFFRASRTIIQRYILINVCFDNYCFHYIMNEFDGGDEGDDEDYDDDDEDDDDNDGGPPLQEGLLNVEPVENEDELTGVEISCLRLKGQMIYLPEAENILFLCSPR